MSGTTTHGASGGDGAGRWVEVRVPLRWADMDAYGHVNNIAVVQVLEEARVAAFGVPANTGAGGGGTAPIDLLEGVAPGVRTFVSEHTVKYRAQMPYRPVPLRVRVGVAAVKAVSVEVRYELYDGVDDTLCATAASVMVFVDGDTGRPVRLTAKQRAALAG
ncbi:acyl-CoA thioesterase [Micrococcus flavus]|uniref:Acyl-CoA thioester hydrolase n=1 Tax=Micrococcus flavus TaxID=384602 RepID=A0A4Y8X1F6_9MICC|nr:thioesterase family protein [Micrococcus flavus]MBB4883397.1 acyl-CoA thioester hydrolase [Micrococcus flavus]TFI02768.1 acyl-CoA thioesterase [Micrococcus flavus]GGK44719.1 thioesterase [Micrococcus flavus]